MKKQYLKTVILAAAAFAVMTWTPLKKLHPLVFIASAAVLGILFQL